MLLERHSSRCGLFILSRAVMGLTCVLANKLIVPNAKGLVIFSIESNSVSSAEQVTLPTFVQNNKDASGDKQDANGKEESSSACPVVAVASSSFRGDSIAVADIHKRIFIYSLENGVSMVEEGKTDRKVASFAFAHHSTTLLILDRTGDVFIWRDYLDSKQQPQLLLGHLSVILDMKLSINDKYILTCDRDEKIRVSHLPNGYNIQSYCLGHKQFVSHLEPVDEETLLSASGDGTIRLWRMTSGEQLAIHDCNLPIKQILLVGAYIIVVFYSEKSCHLFKISEKSITSVDEMSLTSKVLEMHRWTKAGAMFLTDDPEKPCVFVKLTESKLMIDSHIDISNHVDKSWEGLSRELAQDEAQLKFMLKSMK